MNIVGLFDQIDRRGRLGHLGQRDDLQILAMELRREAAEAWDASSEARVRCDDLTAEFERGKAHALCRVLGDQVALSHQIDQRADLDAS